jgi:predicted HTH domain antitoxin
MPVPIVIIETPVPEDIYLTLQASGVFREALAERSRRLLAVRFYRERTLSLGKAARLAGLDRWQFIDLLSENQVPVIDYSDDELAAEFAAVDRLADELHP